MLLEGRGKADYEKVDYLEAMNPMETKTSGEAFEEAKDSSAALLDKADQKENKTLNAVSKAQDALGKLTPVPTDFDAVSSPADLKARLDWGEPALSILDVRDRTAFNEERIRGAMPMPMSDLVDRAKDAFTAQRDLFVYGESDEQTAMAVAQLRDTGFERVSAIKGGLPAWKAMNGPVEGQISG